MLVNSPEAAEPGFKPRRSSSKRLAPIWSLKEFGDTRAVVARAGDIKQILETVWVRQRPGWSGGVFPTHPPRGTARVYPGGSRQLEDNPLQLSEGLKLSLFFILQVGKGK